MSEPKADGLTAAAGTGIVHRVQDGILRITFDRPDSRVNLLTPENLEELGRLLDGVATRDDVRGILFESAKRGTFIAGMDVEAIASVRDSHVAADAARRGQRIFARIRETGRPSVAAVGGASMGGGTELALACDFVVAADGPDTRLALPEVQLGIIPGFGGTQRLPRRVGLAASLDLILTGRSVDARRAARLGLVDLVVPQAWLEREAMALLRRAIESGVERTSAALGRGPGALDRLIGAIGPVRRQLLAQARKRTARKVRPDHYPAPFRALEAIDAAYALPLEEGLNVEARIVGELIPQASTKNLIWLFQAQSAAKSSRPEASGVPPRPVRRAAVLGAGIMGGGIAQLLADRDIPVRLRDIERGALLTALRTARGVWQHKVARKRLSPRELEQKMAAIAPTVDLTGLATVDIVLEAVVENLEIKRRVLAEVEQHVGERTVFASNTSSIPIGEIAARALRPERVVGLHFFNPVHRMPLVEVIAGRRSSPEAVATVRELAVRLGKVPIIVRDGPGFLVNRILTFYVNESLRLLGEGLRIEAIDRAMTDFGMPLGPLALLDQVGLDTARHVGAVLREALGPRVAEGQGAVLDTLVQDGRLGQKSGRGFYAYHDGRRGEPDGKVYQLLGSPAPRDVPAETLQERMVLAMVNEGAVSLQAQVVGDPRDVDLGLVLGTGFPPFRGGLLRHADAVGIPVVVDRLSRLADAHGERFTPAPLLQEMVRRLARFYPERS